MILIYSFNNLPEESETYPDCQVHVQAGQELKMSEIRKNTPHPSFMESFVFLMDQLEPVQVKIMDVNVGTELGSLELEPEMMPLKRKILPVNPDQPCMTATLSAYLKYC